MPRERIELSWGCPRTILSRLRLPIPPPRQAQQSTYSTQNYTENQFLENFFYAKIHLCLTYIPIQFSG